MPARTSASRWEIAWAFLRSRGDRGGEAEVRDDSRASGWSYWMQHWRRFQRAINQDVWCGYIMYKTIILVISWGSVILNMSMIACYRLFKEQSVLLCKLHIFLITIFVKVMK